MIDIKINNVLYSINELKVSVNTFGIVIHTNFINMEKKVLEQINTITINDVTIYHHSDKHEVQVLNNDDMTSFYIVEKI